MKEVLFQICVPVLSIECYDTVILNEVIMGTVSDNLVAIMQLFVSCNSKSCVI